MHAAIKERAMVLRLADFGIGINGVTVCTILKLRLFAYKSRIFIFCNVDWDDGFSVGPIIAYSIHFLESNEHYAYTLIYGIS